MTIERHCGVHRKCRQLPKPPLRPCPTAERRCDGPLPPAIERRRTRKSESPSQPRPFAKTLCRRIPASTILFWRPNPHGGRGKRTAMATKDSVTRWIGELQGGDQDAAAPLWEHYFRRLVGLARKKLRNAPRQAAADEEDVALSAFDSFCRGAQRGQFRELENRGNLWRLLVTLTARKAFDQVREGNAQKRGGGAVRTES